MKKAVATGLCMMLLLSGCTQRTDSEMDCFFKQVKRSAKQENTVEDGDITEETDETKTISFPRSLGVYLLPELVWEMGEELHPWDFFDEEVLERELGLTEEDLKVLTFERELGEELLYMPGSHELRIVAGNQVLTAHLTIQDTTPPVITPPEPTEYNIGDIISYKKGVSVQDNSGEEIELEIDSSQVLPNMAGTYQVRYSATDSSGNTGTATADIIILPGHAATEEEVQALAEEVLDSILKDDMNRLEQAEAIYDWCYGNIRYTARSVKDNVVQGAYDGLYYKMGDCYTFYATAAYLLTACGIENLGVSRKGETSSHYWNLVNVGSGWYHYDTSRHPGGYRCFMQTDAQVRTYSAEYKDTESYFEFDETDMPQRATEILYEN